MRPMTEGAFLLFAGIGERQWQLWKKGERGNEGHQAVAIKISQIIYHQKFDGAASNFLNANIINRELGLADRTVNENVNYNVIVSKEEAIEISKWLDAEI